MAVEVGAGDILVTSRPEDVARADRIVLPGDGAFPACRAALGQYGGLFEAIEEAVIAKARPFLGICVGMQMLASRGHEYRLTRRLRLDRWRGQDRAGRPRPESAAHGLERSGDRPHRTRSWTA
jgi:imidazoleglycerol phosphate synthase glutamine amidotransferase subunit HisH